MKYFLAMTSDIAVKFWTELQADLTCSHSDVQCTLYSVLQTPGVQYDSLLDTLPLQIKDTASEDIVNRRPLIG